jgi:hypothetical protein
MKKKLVILLLALVLAFLVLNLQFLMMGNEENKNASSSAANISSSKIVASLAKNTTPANITFAKNATNITIPAKNTTSANLTKNITNATKNVTNITLPAKNATTPAKNITSANTTPAKNITGPQKNDSKSSGFFAGVWDWAKLIFKDVISKISALIASQNNNRNVSINMANNMTDAKNNSSAMVSSESTAKKIEENFSLVDGNISKSGIDIINLNASGSVKATANKTANKTANESEKISLLREPAEIKIARGSKTVIDMNEYISNPKDEELEFIVFKQQGLALKFDGSKLTIESNENSSEKYAVVVYATNGEDIVNINLNVKVASEAEAKRSDFLAWLSSSFDSAMKYSSKHIMLLWGAAAVIVIVLIFSSGLYRKIADFFLEDDSETPKKNGKKAKK